MSERFVRWATKAGPLAICVASALIGISAFWVFSPWLASIRSWVLVGAAVVALASVSWASRDAWRGRTRAGGALVVTALAGPLVFLGQVFEYRQIRNRVLSAPPDALVRAGRHVVVGYRDQQEIADLVRRGAVGGLFVTARNARGKTVDQLAAEISGLQALASTSGHPRLIVTTDQEGGFVARLSPPLKRPPLLASVIKDAPSANERRERAFAEGVRVGADLGRVGITLNLAPLADLDFGIRNAADRMSRIGERAIGTDPEIVAEVAKAYCDGMASAGVACTLKHFPGLGRVVDDTHVTSATLDAPRADLAARDWLPYRRDRKAVTAAVMVAHVVATATDPKFPASVSRPTVTETLRQELGHEGLVITDDLCMAAISDRPDGIARAAGDAVHQAGVDLVLVAYDPPQVYRALAGLLAKGDTPAAAASRQRLAGAAGR